MLAPQSPYNMEYETEHCLVRDLGADDAREEICNWMSDSAVAAALNASVRRLSITDVRKYLAQHDRIAGHAPGVFDKATNQLIGIWTIYVDWPNEEFLVNVLLAERVDAELGGSRETGRPLYQIMFEELGLETMRFNILATNATMMSRMSRPPEHTTVVPAADGKGTVSINHYRTTKQRWQELRANRVERDAAILEKRCAGQRARA